MSMTELKLSFPTEKLEALRFFMDKKQQTVEQELKEYLDKTYEKLVPAQVRDYVESRMGQAPAQASAPEPEEVPAARERAPHQPRRHREQALEAPARESTPQNEEAFEQDSQGMAMRM